MTDFHAEVDIGAESNGKVYKANISREVVNNIQDVVKTGQRVKVRVLNTRDDRVTLTMIIN